MFPSTSLRERKWYLAQPKTPIPCIYNFENAYHLYMQKTFSNHIHCLQLKPLSSFGSISVPAFPYKKLPEWFEIPRNRPIELEAAFGYDSLQTPSGVDAIFFLSQWCFPHNRCRRSKGECTYNRKSLAKSLRW